MSANRKGARSWRAGHNLNRQKSARVCLPTHQATSAYANQKWSMKETQVARSKGNPQLVLRPQDLLVLL